MKNEQFRSLDRFLEKEEYPLWLVLNHHKTHTNRYLTLDKHQYLKEILMDKSRFRVYKKSTQGGVSEVLIVISWSAAVKGNTIFYMLPTHGLMKRFVTNRYEKSLSYTRYYQEHKSDSKSQSLSKEMIDNQTLKDIGAGVIAFAGSRSEVPLVEIPADWLIVDELAKCDADNVEMAKERLGHASDPHMIYVGNPSYIGDALDEKWDQSTKSRWHIQGECGHWNKLNFFDHIVEKIGEQDYVIRDPDYDAELDKDIRPICSVCGKPFDRYSEGEYVDEGSAIFSGKHISRLFSGTGTIREIVNNFSAGLVNDVRMQRVYNSDFGESYTSAGSKLTYEMLDELREDYIMPDTSKMNCVAGIDVGGLLHIHIAEVLSSDLLRTVYLGEVSGGYEEIITLFRAYNVKFFVIDSMPEIRLARKLVNSWTGCDCNVNSKNREFSFNRQTKTISQIRTAFLDNVKENVLLRKILLPKNARKIPNYYDQMTNSVRVFDEDKEEYSWIHGSKPDHYMFATGYMLLAKRMYLTVR